MRTNTLSEEEARVKERESDAEKLKEESTGEREKYEILYKELDEEKAKIKTLAEEAELNLQEAERKNTASNAIFEKAKSIDEEIAKKTSEFEKERLRIEESLRGKIDEYDRRLEDLKGAKGLVDDIKFDKSREGQEAKIVVKEAIRQAKKVLADSKTKFEELDEKYSNGTFKGFSTPLSDIDKDFQDLKAQYEQIKEHIAANENLPSSVVKLLESIEECIIKADENIKSWEFSTAFRHIVSGLSTCRSYEMLLTILNDWGSESSPESGIVEDDGFVDWYDIMEVAPEATSEEIKKQYRLLMKKYHPDRSTSENSDENSKMAAKINEANEILSDKEKRLKFDEQRTNRKKKK